MKSLHESDKLRYEFTSQTSYSCLIHIIFILLLLNAFYLFIEYAIGSDKIIALLFFGLILLFIFPIIFYFFISSMIRFTKENSLTLDKEFLTYQYGRKNIRRIDTPNISYFYLQEHEFFDEEEDISPSYSYELRVILKSGQDLGVITLYDDVMINLEETKFITRELSEHLKIPSSNIEIRYVEN